MFSIDLTNQYTSAIKSKEKEEQDARLNKARPTFKGLLAGNPDVHHYSTFRTLDKLFAQHPGWASLKNENERKILFDEHVNELKAIELVSFTPPFGIVLCFNISAIEPGSRIAHTRDAKTRRSLQSS